MRRATRVRRDVSQETLLRLAYKAKNSPEALQVLQDALAETYPRLWTMLTETAERRAKSTNTKWYVLFNARQLIIQNRRRAKKKISTSYRVIDWSLEPLKLVDNNQLTVRMKFSSREIAFTPYAEIRQNPNKYLDTYFDSDKGNIIVYVSRQGDQL